jgi:hypothetical protein
VLFGSVAGSTLTINLVGAFGDAPVACVQPNCGVPPALWKNGNWTKVIRLSTHVHNRLTGEPL